VSPRNCGPKVRDSWNSIANPRERRGSRTFGPHRLPYISQPFGLGCRMALWASPEVDLKLCLLVRVEVPVGRSCLRQASFPVVGACQDLEIRLSINIILQC
jgi:hypothetical protein